MNDELRLWAVRGAVKAEANEADAIVEATEVLMRELMSRNELDAGRIVSCLFTATDDLNAEFPAVAARRLGLDSVPLLCTRELDVPGAMRSVIRVLVHYHAPVDHVPQHAYLGEAQDLRTDLHSAQ
ncbi:MAG TPA: chorismate mutase [Solirubrobacterales bacterium]|jgi:chorismate mutase